MRARIVIASSNSSTPLFGVGPRFFVPAYDTPRWGHLARVEAAVGEAAILLAPGSAEHPSRWAVGPIGSVAVAAAGYARSLDGRARDALLDRLMQLVAEWSEQQESR